MASFTRALPVRSQVKSVVKALLARSQSNGQRQQGTTGKELGESMVKALLARSQSNGQRQQGTICGQGVSRTASVSRALICGQGVRRTASFTRALPERSQVKSVVKALPELQLLAQHKNASFQECEQGASNSPQIVSVISRASVTNKLTPILSLHTMIGQSVQRNLS